MKANRATGIRKNIFKDVHGLKKSRAVPPELHDLGSCVKVVEDDNVVVRGLASELAVVPSESAASSAAAETSATSKTPPTTAPPLALAWPTWSDEESDTVELVSVKCNCPDCKAAPQDVIPSA